MGLFGKKPLQPERTRREPREPRAPKQPPGPTAAELNARVQAGGVAVFGCGCPGSIWNDNDFRVMVTVWFSVLRDGKPSGSVLLDSFPLEPKQEKPLKFVNPNHRFLVWSEQGGICVRLKPIPNGRPDEGNGQTAAAT